MDGQVRLPELGGQRAELHPLLSWGALAWPLALLMHGWLLRRQRQWIDEPLLPIAHVAGAWLLVSMERSPDPSTDARRVTLIAHGGDWAARLARLTD